MKPTFNMYRPECVCYRLHLFPICSL